MVCPSEYSSKITSVCSRKTCGWWWMKHQMQSHWQKCAAVSAAFDSRLVGAVCLWCIKIAFSCKETTQETKTRAECGVYREIKVSASYFVKLKDCTYYKRKYFPQIRSVLSNKRKFCSDTILINTNIRHTALQLHWCSTTMHCTEKIIINYIKRQIEFTKCVHIPDKPGLYMQNIGYAYKEGPCSCYIYQPATETSKCSHDWQERKL